MHHRTMNRSTKWLAFTLLAVGCGRPLASVSSDSSSTSETDSSTSETDSSTSDTSTSETDTESTSETGQPGLIPPPDDFPLGIECDIFTQDCAVGDKCVPYASSGNYFDNYKCVPVLGDQSVGEPCTYTNPADSTDDCDATSFCWFGTCESFCTGTPDDPECPPGSSCLLSADFGIVVCIDSCDPTLQDCNDDFACHWNSSFTCAAPTQDIPAGEPCEAQQDCIAGTFCAAASGLSSCADASCCTPYCEIGDDLPCAVMPETACVPFFEEDQAIPGYEHVGVCLVPP